MTSTKFSVDRSERANWLISNQFSSFIEIKANAEMIEKLKALENKVIIGGENLLEKAELQEKLLAESELELEKQR